ncbi:MAG: zinc metallopeptidase [Eubacteriales bacterium]|nr:zinc metallopeptidase [Eubacteriales bacterium]
MYRYYGYGLDWTYILVIIALLFSVVVQARMKSTFAKYQKIHSSCGLTGAEAARRILESEGLYNVQIRPIAGSLTDNYNPADNTVNLSESVYGSTSLAAIGVAAHECGHAIQHARDYAPLSVRSALVPAANIGSRGSWVIFIIGLMMSRPAVIKIGILMFCAVLAFQLVTLPVEFNASRRALAKLGQTGLMAEEEIGGTRRVLRAAAMTYVAAVCSSMMHLARMIILSGGRRRD